MCQTTDQIAQEDTADRYAEGFIKDNGEEFAYVYRLHKVFRKKTDKDVEETFVDPPLAVSIAVSKRAWEQLAEPSALDQDLSEFFYGGTD